jgi:hypothetical protein
VRGDTYYIADGTYPAYTFDDNRSGNLQIKIIKATVQDHGTNTGWQNSYGDGAAVWGYGTGFSRSYYVFDGITGTGKVSGSYGFKVAKPPCTTHPQSYFGIYAPSIRVSHLEIEACGIDYNVTQQTVKIVSTHDDTLSHCFVWKAQNCVVTEHAYNVIIEHNYFKDQWSSSEHHGATTQGRDTRDCIYCFNTLEGGSGTGTAVWMKALSRELLVGETAHNLRWQVYGNVFYNCSKAVYSGTSASGEIMVDFDIHNNTFVGGSGRIFAQKEADYGKTSGRVYNNIMYNCHGASIEGIATHDYNTALNCPQYLRWTIEDESHGVVQDGASDPFVNSGAGDFRLIAATAAGKVLAASFNLDPEGKTRGEDGVWDRGAFEYSNTGVSWQFTVDSWQASALPGLIPGGTIDGLRIYNLVGNKVLPQQLSRTGIYLIPIERSIQIMTIVR